MVIIEELSVEESVRRKRAKKLADIAREVFPEGKVSLRTDCHIIIYPRKVDDQTSRHSFMVSLTMGNRIEVYNPEHFESSLKLAESYETRGEGEFTVRKNYED